MCPAVPFARGVYHSSRPPRGLAPIAGGSSLWVFQSRLWFNHEINDAGKPARRAGALRPLWRQVRAGNADASVAGAGTRVLPLPGRPGVSPGVRILSQGILRAADSALLRRTADQGT